MSATRRTALKAALAFPALARVASSAQALSDVRVALVIGNSGYPGRMALTNPVNDAAAISAVLKGMGFTVIEARDASRHDMDTALTRLLAALRGKSGVGLLYYAGHGLQVDWKNYMVPVDARLQRLEDVPRQTVDVADVLDVFKASGSRMNIVVLDACRDSPFAASGSKGLAPLDAPPGTFLAYATAPGNVAEDGSGTHGLYTKHLLNELQKPVSIENVFKRVRLNVRKESGGRQVPWESTSLEEEFFFMPEAGASRSSARQRDAEFAEQKAAWDRIKDSARADDFYAFLDAYPSGMLAEVAQARLELLNRSSVQLQPPKGEAAQARISDRLKVGDEWTTLETDSMGGLFGASTEQHVYKVTQALGELLEVKRGALATFYYTAQGAYGGLDQPLVPKVNYDPPVPMLPLGPFQVGYKAVSRSTNIRSGAPVGQFEASMHVQAREKITTKMGTFDTYRIEVRANVVGAMGGATETVYTRWYEPDSAIPLKEILGIAAVGRRITKETIAIRRAAT